MAKSFFIFLVYFLTFPYLLNAEVNLESLVDNLEKRSQTFQVENEELLKNLEIPELEFELEALISEAEKKSDLISKTCPRKTVTGLFIFISNAIPKSSLISLAKQANDYSAMLVMRGFVNDSFKETVVFIQELNEQGNRAMIDPETFAKYDIEQVPAFVLNQDDINYDKISGNITLTYALEQFAASGDTRVLAQEILSAVSQ